LTITKTKVEDRHGSFFSKWFESRYGVPLEEFQDCKDSIEFSLRDLEMIASDAREDELEYSKEVAKWAGSNALVAKFST
jgi:hypothetical protein